MRPDAGTPPHVVPCPLVECPHPASALRDVQEVLLPRDVLEATVEVLREFGRHGLEGLVLWFGEIAAGRATVREHFLPDQRSYGSDDGAGYVVGGATLLEINRYLSERRLRLLAQVHSHPSEAYHSRADDEYAIVTTEGGFSIVLPDFAQGPPSLSCAAVFRQIDGEWKQMSTAEVDSVFTLV